MQPLTAIDLFSGIGGIKQGLTKAGFKVIYSNDIDKYCKLTFEANFPEEKIDTRDIAKIPFDDLPDNFDLLAAGFPCQPFSLAGLKKGFEDPRGHLFFTTMKIIENKKPRAFLLENVKNLKSHNKGKTLVTILKELRKIGYYVPDPVILNSKDFGLPQNRERIYIVGFKKEVGFEFPITNGLSQKIEDILERDVDTFYFLSQQYYECLDNHKKRHKSKGNGFGFEILDPKGISHALVVGNMGRERNLIQDKSRKGFYKNGMDKKLKNKYGIRKLTIRECARLQGFDDNFIFPVSKTQAYKQLGNTVSIPVIRAVSEEIKKILKKKHAVKYKQNYVFKEQTRSLVTV